MGQLNKGQHPAYVPASMTIRRLPVNISALLVTASRLMKTLLLTFVSIFVGISSGIAQVQTPGTFGDAMRWYQRAAEAGSAQAQFYLGLMHETGTNRTIDLAEATRWYSMAARQDHALAQYKYATALHFGHGVAVDSDTAAEWYEKAARNNIPQAAFNLGYMREHGQGGTKDIAAAADWYRRAAIKGVVQARYNLGVLLARGEGVTKNLIEAWVLFDLAAAQKLDKAAAARIRIEANMSKTEIEKARALRRKSADH